MNDADVACVTCGRRIEPRRRWASRGQQTLVRHCSAACRRERPNAIDRALEDAIVALLEARARDATICPSEAARAVAPESWRTLMERARRAARRLVAAGRAEVVQRSRVVDPSTARGPIRVRLREPRR